MSAWTEFKKGKLKKQDITKFAENLEEELFDLHGELREGSYRHGSYTPFVICDPKRRNVHKASARDRLLHHAIFRVLEPIFDRSFIYDSFSSRKGKGIHKAHERFRQLAWKLSRNNTRTVWVLKCDVRKFFDSVDHRILLSILEKRVDKATLALLRNIIESFEKTPGRGIPIGNLTSQLFSNIYLNEFDHFVKLILRKSYIRYADDFVILSEQREKLEAVVPVITEFLKEKLHLDLHPNKIIIRKWRQGIDFLGYVIFPSHQILRTKTKRRVLRQVARRHRQLLRGTITSYSFSQTLQSYLGMLTHCRGRVVGQQLEPYHKPALNTSSK